MSRPKGLGIPCPSCGSSAAHVSDTRTGRGFIRRRRNCLGCGERWTTYERAEDGLHGRNPEADALALFRAAVEKLDPLRHVPVGAAGFMTAQLAKVLLLRLGGRSAQQIAIEVGCTTAQANQAIRHVRELLFDVPSGAGIPGEEPAPLESEPIVTPRAAADVEGGRWPAAAL